MPTGGGLSRSGHTATLLRDGRVLVAGGDDGTGAVTAAEIYDPAGAPGSQWTTLAAGLVSARMLLIDTFHLTSFNTPLGGKP